MGTPPQNLIASFKTPILCASGPGILHSMGGDPMKTDSPIKTAWFSTASCQHMGEDGIGCYENLRHAPLSERNFILFGLWAKLLLLQWFLGGRCFTTKTSGRGRFARARTPTNKREIPAIQAWLGSFLAVLCPRFHFKLTRDGQFGTFSCVICNYRCLLAPNLDSEPPSFRFTIFGFWVVNGDAESRQSGSALKVTNFGIPAKSADKGAVVESCHVLIEFGTWSCFEPG